MKTISILFAPLLVLMSAAQATVVDQRVILSTSHSCARLGPKPSWCGCKISKRIDSKDADCLEAGYTNSYPWYYFGFAKGKAWARNKCSRKGGIMVKVDRGQGALDWAWRLDGGNKKSKTGTGRINGVYCCTDRSDKGLCED